MWDFLKAEVKEKKVRLEEVTKQRAKLESVKHRLENQLSTNLLRKRESLQAVCLIFYLLIADITDL